MRGGAYQLSLLTWELNPSIMYRTNQAKFQQYKTIILKKMELCCCI